MFLFLFAGIGIMTKIETMIEIEDVAEIERGIGRGTETGIGTVIA